MYIVTFFSYKGGVGRTMALVNTALDLSKRGKRVLVVDFDLEAPGLPSYELFKCAAGRPGVVDYVAAYVETAASPNVADYISECEPGKIWLMGAGDYTSERYSARLASIDWQDLYENHEGFLMFEDLKQQWVEYQGHGFDYVLVDSRTGHTDVGGICTRQLPDAVVVMFLPNDQNISGLDPIVSAIRREAGTPREKKITLHFCPSNVPDLDDEQNILQDLLDRSEEKLGYKRTAAVIHHYASLQLLNQVPFAQARPNSRLAKEYKELTTAITASNYEDKDGATVALQRIRAAFRRAREERSNEVLSELSEATRAIRRHHSADPEIAWLLAQVYAEMRSHEDEIAALTVAIDGGYRVEAARLARATTYMQLSDQEHAAEDFRAILMSSSATGFEVAPAVDMLRTVTTVDDWLSTVTACPTLDRLEPAAAAIVASGLMTERRALPLALPIWSGIQASRTATASQKDSARVQRILCLIGTGAFSSALGAISRSRKKVVSSDAIEDVFNYGVAEWGDKRVAPVDLFKRVLELAHGETSERGSNFHQCLALAHHVVGEPSKVTAELALARETARTRGREFSCWSYLEIGRRDLLNDIREMERSLAGGPSPVEPRFFSEVRSTTIH